MKYLASISLVVVAMFAFALSGCGTTAPEPTTSDAPAVSDGHTEHDHGDHDEHGEAGQTDMEKMKAELAKMSPEDAASAEKQHMCPVSNEMLGAMGAPMKVDVNGQQVWICCDGCRENLLENPDKYLANLK